MIILIIIIFIFFLVLCVIISFTVRLFLLICHFYFSARIFLPIVNNSSQLCKMDLAGYVSYAQCREQYFLFSRKGRSMESKKVLIGYVAFNY